MVRIILLPLMAGNAYFHGALEVMAGWAMLNRKMNLFQGLLNSLILNPKELRVFIVEAVTLWLLTIWVINCFQNFPKKFFKKF